MMMGGLSIMPCSSASLAARRRTLEETPDQPRNRTLREGLRVDIQVLEANLAVERAKIGTALPVRGTQTGEST